MKTKGTMFLLKILVHLCTIIHDLVEEKFFVVIVSQLLVLKKYKNVVLKIALKLMVNKGLRKVNTLDLKIMKGK